MATGREIMAIWDEREARERDLARARSRAANDNAPREPDGYLEIDGEMVAYWLPPGVRRHEPASVIASATAAVH